MQSGRWLEVVARRIERASALDRLAASALGLGRKAVPEGPAKEVLQGTPLGHPLHPALVAVPIGAWARMERSELVMEAVVCSVDGTQCVRERATASPDQAAQLGEHLARVLAEGGARTILEEVQRARG